MGIIPDIRDGLEPDCDCKTVAFLSSSQINMQHGDAISKELKAHGQASSGFIAARKQNLQKHHRNQTIFMESKSY